MLSPIKEACAGAATKPTATVDNKAEKVKLFIFECTQNFVTA
ncbi:hypothetical protein CWATWH8502_4442 [Crocosphaera watsonii WH 8502]|uniref:Uncharacterized protein n=3 Tax=Crocosphaera watsonii TaxID=263511 RepID=T2JJ69_CROWT|nr:hypothetical protein CWATWH8502_4442 [Crocosphaera watsonii WH 8502]CCQ55643.1 hypothetical protein CWATWH0005_3905 [Crocosphaera watsonii WH 0005]CCQ65305.1 hypothetical protein CWATWH0402_2316 [Crocosphaera watsonii WH 0402]